jgi:itaconyl-CoA hydratase
MPQNQDSGGRRLQHYEIGAVYRSSQGRTVTQSDNLWFTLLTNNNNQIHYNAVYAVQAGYRDCLVNTMLTIAVVGGLSVNDVSANGVNLGLTDIEMLNPVYPGDTLYSQSEVLSVRDSASRPEQGIVTVRTEGFNQDGACVCRYIRTILVWKEGFGPSFNHFPEVALDGPASDGQR